MTAHWKTRRPAKDDHHVTAARRPALDHAPKAREVHAGDPDPTPDVGPFCGRVNPKASASAPYPCTQRLGHGPSVPHVGGDSVIVRTVWRN